ncbi:hypothetical protein CRG98_042896, partial [Punica granatum]
LVHKNPSAPDALSGTIFSTLSQLSNSLTDAHSGHGGLTPDPNSLVLSDTSQTPPDSGSSPGHTHRPTLSDAGLPQSRPLVAAHSRPLGWDGSSPDSRPLESPPKTLAQLVANRQLPLSPGPIHELLDSHSLSDLQLTSHSLPDASPPQDRPSRAQ